MSSLDRYPAIPSPVTDAPASVTDASASVTDASASVTDASIPLSWLGELLIALRKERGLTQQQLAERLGSHQEAVARMERERYRNISLERLVNVAEALEVDIVVRPSQDVTNKDQAGS